MTHAAIEQRLLDRLSSTEGASPIIFLSGTRGSGRSRLLGRIAGRLAPRGVLPVIVDAERSGACPRALARALVDGVTRAAALAGHAPFAESKETARMALSLTAEMARARPDAALVLSTAFSFPRAAALEIGQPIALLLDEIGETLPMSRHAGLRGLDALLAAQLAAGSDVPVLATVSPASRAGALVDRVEQAAREAGRPFERLDMPWWTREEMTAFLAGSAGGPPSDADVEAWMRATGGRPLTARALARVALGPEGAPLVEAIAAAMTPPDGLLHLECRFDYHLLVERSRGHAAVRSILDLIARRGAVNLTAVARHVRTSLPTAMDYLAWMMEVGLIRRERRSYRSADPLLGLWVALNGPQPRDPLEEAARLLAIPAATAPPAPSPEGATSSILFRPAPEPAPPRRGDFPMGID